MKDWQPLTNIWEDYSHKLDEVESAELGEDIVYPTELFMGDMEKDDIKQFVSDRIEEMVAEAHGRGGINLQWIGGYLFKSLVTGMLWERERVGR